MKLQIFLFTFLILSLTYSCQNEPTKQVTADKQDTTKIEKDTLVQENEEGIEETPGTNPEKYNPEERYLYIANEKRFLEDVFDTFRFSSGKELKLASLYSKTTDETISGLVVFDEDKVIYGMGFMMLLDSVFSKNDTLFITNDSKPAFFLTKIYEKNNELIIKSSVKLEKMFSLQKQEEIVQIFKEMPKEWIDGTLNEEYYKFMAKKGYGSDKIMYDVWLCAIMGNPDCHNALVSIDKKIHLDGARGGVHSVLMTSYFLFKKYEK